MKKLGQVPFAWSNKEIPLPTMSDLYIGMNVSGELLPNRVKLWTLKVVLSSIIKAWGAPWVVGVRERTKVAKASVGSIVARKELGSIDIALAKILNGNSSTIAFLILRVVLHTVVVISEELRLSTRSCCSRCCRAHLYWEVKATWYCAPAVRCGLVPDGPKRAETDHQENEITKRSVVQQLMYKDCNSQLQPSCDGQDIASCL